VQSQVVENMRFDELKKEIEEKVRELVEPVADYSGLELVLVEFVRGPRGHVLRIVIDKEGGVTLDDCSRLSRVVSDLLDVHDPVPGSYNLEVSSPGINRPLVKKDDFDRFSGQKIFVRTSEPVEGRRKFKGMLRGMSLKDEIIIETTSQQYLVPFELVNKARLDIL